MKDFEPTRPRTDVENVRRMENQYNLRHRYQIRRYNGQSFFRVDKFTEVAHPMDLKREALLLNDGKTVIKSEVIMDEEKFFYCFALNKRNAERHFHDWKNSIEEFVSKFDRLKAALITKYPGVSEENIVKAINTCDMNLYLRRPVPFMDKIDAILNPTK